MRPLYILQLCCGNNSHFQKQLDINCTISLPTDHLTNLLNDITHFGYRPGSKVKNAKLFANSVIGKLLLAKHNNNYPSKPVNYNIDSSNTNFFICSNSSLRSKFYSYKPYDFILSKEGFQDQF